ncbi:amylo-alpha-1,6-glucosidase [Actinoplanes sp. DH11]|uniref:amylo-alpha-1,6-glucosidase n=1 Tax=Actinoplanes sp. DH11 TaxID=2857011 RepID=UPI001E53CDFF|nr:glycogen debranching protein [Actinoplanes sp. DH11]
MMFSIRDIPFSHRGSWFGISPVLAENTVADDLHLVSHQTGMHPVLRFNPSEPSVVRATPALLTWQTDAGPIELAYESPDTIRIRGNGPGLRITAAAGTLTPFRGSYLYQDPVDGSHILTSYETGRRYRVTLLAGGPAEVTGAELLGAGERGLRLPAGPAWEVAIEEYGTARPAYRRLLPFAAVHDAAQARFAAFADALAPWRSASTPAAELAAYVLWSATVDPAGFVTRPAVLMSKHWMDKVWSWDHCFNAIALAAGDPALARAQFQLPFDHQDPSGALPDSITHSEVLHNFVKPPIHGWALRQLMPAGLDDLAGTYDRLARWTRFWLDARRAPGEDLPHYTHGNDSGWDNATTFDGGRVVQTADLAAFLVLQLRCLADLAHRAARGPALPEPAPPEPAPPEPGPPELAPPELARTESARTESAVSVPAHTGSARSGEECAGAAGERTAEAWAEAAAEWARAADRIQEAMIRDLWTGDRFEARDPLTGARRASASLLDLMPIVLGDELPEPIATRLAARIEQHLTSFGLATEPVDSPEYAADGYWRGPIWAPSTVLIEDGLRRAGHTALADEVSRRFRALCEQSGFAENFDAETGAGLRDRAYTWTASCYLILAAAHEHRRTTAPPDRAAGDD